MEENGSCLYEVSRDGRTNQECLWFKTICHGGDSHKLCFFSETKDFYCYTCCGRMTFFNFIMRIKDITKFNEAVFYVAQKAGIKFEKERIGIGDKSFTKEFRAEVKSFNRTMTKHENSTMAKKPVEIQQFYDPNILNYFDSSTFYKGWLKEGISIESMKKFNIRWYEYQKHIIIPHYNLNGKLVGIRRRSLKPEDSRNKYMPECIEGKTYEHPLGLNLYGLYENKEAIQRYGTVILTEAEKSVLLSDTYYGNNSITVATCGFNISNWQLKTLLQLGVENIYIAYDKDFDFLKENEYKRDSRTWANYTRYREKLRNLCEKTAPYCSTYLISDRKGYLEIKDSPYDKGKLVLEKLIKEKKRIYTTERIE